MKRIFLFFLTILLSAPVFAGFVDNERQLSEITTVKNVLKMHDNSFVVMKGNILKQIGKEKYLFTDGTAEIRVDIDDKLWTNFVVTPKTKVILKGEVDKDLHSIEVDISNVEITD